MAAGLAFGGLLPVVAIYSTFLQRAYDQLIMDVALQNLHVVFCLDRAGLVGEDGPTHHGVFDLTYLRSIPNMMVLAPADEAELADALHTALWRPTVPSRSAIRAAPASACELPEEPMVLGGGRAREIRRQGSDVALLAVGRMVGSAEKAAELLAAEGISASVVNARWVKPLDLETVSWAAANHPLVVTIEENTARGGFGAAVLRGAADLGLESHVLRARRAGLLRDARRDAPAPRRRRTDSRGRARCGPRPGAHDPTSRTLRRELGSDVAAASTSHSLSGACSRRASRHAQRSSRVRSGQRAGRDEGGPRHRRR